MTFSIPHPRTMGLHGSNAYVPYERQSEGSESRAEPTEMHSLRPPSN
jgi:hypothetical protein